MCDQVFGGMYWFAETEPALPYPSSVYVRNWGRMPEEFFERRSSHSHLASSVFETMVKVPSGRLSGGLIQMEREMLFCEGLKASASWMETSPAPSNWRAAADLPGTEEESKENPPSSRPCRLLPLVSEAVVPEDSSRGRWMARPPSAAREKRKGELAESLLSMETCPVEGPAESKWMPSVVEAPGSMEDAGGVATENPVPETVAEEMSSRAVPVFRMVKSTVLPPGGTPWKSVPSPGAGEVSPLEMSAWGPETAMRGSGEDDASARRLIWKEVSSLSSDWMEMVAWAVPAEN